MDMYKKCWRKGVVWKKQYYGLGKFLLKENSHLNPEFASLPESIRQNFRSCAYFTTEDVGIFMVVYNEDGELELK